MRLRILGIIMMLGVAISGYAQGSETEGQSEEQIKMAQWNVNHSYRVFQAALSLSDLAAAKNALLDILVEVEQNDSILFELGTIYFQMKNYRASAVCATELLKTNPNNLPILELAAVSYENLGVSEKALEYYEKMYLKSEDFNSLYKTAIFQMELERFSEANNNLDILISKPESSESTVNLPITGGGTKEYPITALLHNMKGLVLQGMGKKEEARKQFQASLAIAPEFSTAKEYLEALDK